MLSNYIMNFTPLNDKQKADMKMGLNMEEALKPVFENKFGTLSYTKHFDNFDYENDKYLIELKTRKARWGQYPSLMFSTAKIRKAELLFSDETFTKDIYFFWKLTDGLYYWKYQVGEYEVAIGGRNDRGMNEYQNVVYIMNQYIKNYNDLSM